MPAPPREKQSYHHVLHVDLSDSQYQIWSICGQSPLIHVLTMSQSNINNNNNKAAKKKKEKEKIPRPNMQIFPLPVILHERNIGRDIGYSSEERLTLGSRYNI